MKKISAVMLAMLLFVGVSFAARGGYESSSSSSSGSTVKSSNSNSTRFGLGYSKIETPLVDVDSIAGRFWFSDILGMDISLGFRSGDLQSVFIIGAKIIGNFVKVNKLNVYWLAGFAFGSYDPKEEMSSSLSLFRLRGGVGAEYFVLPCLSVLTEMGLEYNSASADGNSVNDFGTFADWLPQAGVRFYFN